MKLRWQNWGAVFLSLGCSFICSCAIFGGGKDELVRTKEYRVTAPKEWKAESNDDESDYAYHLPSSSTATVTSSCRHHTGVALNILTRQLLIGARNIVIEKKERILVSGSEGEWTWVRATLDGVPFFLELFVLPKQRCVFDFSLVSPKPISEVETKQFLSFIKSFEYGTN